MWGEGSTYRSEEALADIDGGVTIIMDGFVWYRRRNANSKEIPEVIEYFCLQ